jgi:hypothetical protein
LLPAIRMLLKVADVLPTVPLAGVGGDPAALDGTITAKRTANGTSSKRSGRAVFIGDSSRFRIDANFRASRPFEQSQKVGMLSAPSYP